MSLRTTVRELLTSSGWANDVSFDEVAITDVDSLLLIVLVGELEYDLGRPVAEQLILTWETIEDVVDFAESVKDPV